MRKKYRTFKERLSVDLKRFAPSESKKNQYFEEVMKDIELYGVALSNPGVEKDAKKAYNLYLERIIQQNIFDEPTRIFCMRAIEQAKMVGERERMQNFWKTFKGYLSLIETKKLNPKNINRLEKKANELIDSECPKNLAPIYQTLLKEKTSKTKR